MELLVRCRDFALPFYGDLLRSAQQTLRERLFEQASASTSTDEQRFFDAIHQLNERGAAMCDAFAAQLQRGYEAFLEGRDDDPLPAPQPQDLTLVAREQLEDQLAVSMIVSRADGQNAEALWKLNRRLAAARGGRKVGDDDNPFGPARVGVALRVAMGLLDVDGKARIFIYKHLGKLLLASFGRVFDALNQILIDGGVLPNLRFVVEKQPSPEPPAPGVAAAAAVAATTAAAVEQQLYASIVEILRRRWSVPSARRQTAGGVDYAGLATGQDGAPGNFLPMDYALVLSALQLAPELNARGAMHRPLPIDVVEQKLFAQLKRRAVPEQRHQMAVSDADTVDLVGMIFRYMLDDPKIPDVVKSLLSHLHTPYLKLALLDPQFLADQQHPARVLLDRMAEAGARWVGDDKDRTALPRLKTIVESILEGFVDDPALFGRLLEDFERFRESLDKRAEMAEKRNRAAQEGIERLAAARGRAADAIAARTDGLELPEPVRQLLQKPWADFLAFNLLRNGETSAAWHGALQVVESLLWSLQPGRDAAQLQRVREQLRTALTDGMQTIGFDTQAAAGLLQALEEAQDRAQAGDVVLREATAPAAGAAAAPEPTPAQLELVDRLRNRTPFGTLFEFDGDGEPPQRLKLAWFSRITAHYMFVNQAGVKQRLEPLSALVQGLEAGTIRIVDAERRGFMERALQAVLERLGAGG